MMISHVWVDLRNQMRLLRPDEDNELLCSLLVNTYSGKSHIGETL